MLMLSAMKISLVAAMLQAGFCTLAIGLRFGLKSPAGARSTISETPQQDLCKGVNFRRFQPTGENTT